MKNALNIIACCCMLCLMSCHHKDIMCPGSEEYQVNIVFEWDKAAGASPDGMTLYFYSENGDCRKFDIAGKSGGPILLPAGQYSMVAYNNDLPSVEISDTQSFREIKAEARNVKGKNCLSYAGMLYESTVDKIEVTPCGVTYQREDGTVKDCGRSVIRCYPDSITSIYSVVIRNISGISGVSHASATIKGIAEGQFLYNHHFFGFLSESYFPLSVDTDNKTFRGTAGVFSSGKSGTSYTLSLTVSLADGTSYVKELDITPQIMNSKYPHNVLIVIDGLKIPESGTPSPPVGGDIDVDVEGWEIVEIDINTDMTEF